jgi:membrane protease subunit (stomatin/prohibitin family)
MAIGDFIRKQFIDVIEWLEDDSGPVVWRFPMVDQEIQNGAQLTVRDGQAAVFVSEGRIADVFEAGRWRLSTRTLPLLTNLQNWDKGFASPFKSDVVFVSLRPQLDRRWGTPQPVVLRDKDFGAMRFRAFGNFSWRVADPALFYKQVAGARERVASSAIDEPLRALVVQHLADAVGDSGLAFLDLAANQADFASAIHKACTAEMAQLGVALQAVTVQSVTLPEELQKLLDQKSGMAMVGGDMGRFVQYQTGQALPALAAGAAGGGAAGGGAGGGGGGVMGDALGLGAGVALGQMLAQQLQGSTAATGAAAVATVKPDEVLATLERLGELHSKGVLTADEFSAKKTELLRKLS